MKIFTFLNPAAWAALAWFLTTPALAHVTLEHQVAHASSRYKATFKIGHGCGPSPTRQFVVHVPAGVTLAKPMPKPGWQLSITRGQAVPEGSAAMASQEVSRITWTAQTTADYLANEHYDEFSLVGKLPGQAGLLYWPVSQICTSGRLDWHQTPVPGQGPQALKTPAPALELIPGASGTHSH